MAATDILTDKEDGPRATDELTGAGSAGLTKKLRVEYGRENETAQTEGQEAKPWAEWLRERGYALDNRGLVYRVNSD